jgi:polyisoprenoid-binding protein YceI
MRLLIALLALSCMNPSIADDYRIDPARTSVRFDITALGVFNQDGRFERVRGTVALDESSQSGEIHIEIDAASIETGLALRDMDFRGERWFDVARFPTLAFHGRQFVFEAQRLAAIDGMLTLRGVTRPLRFRVERFHCGRLGGGQDGCAAVASARLRRSDFGMDAYSLLVGDEVRLRVEIEAPREGETGVSAAKLPGAN